jgi:hypothetical protein
LLTLFRCSESCIKGHRSSACKHNDRPLFEVKKKGRPITQCEHCRELRKTKQVHVKCMCGNKEKSTDDVSLPLPLPVAIAAMATTTTTTSTTAAVPMTEVSEPGSSKSPPGSTSSVVGASESSGRGKKRGEPRARRCLRRSKRLTLHAVVVRSLFGYLQSKNLYPRQRSPRGFRWKASKQQLPFKC